MGKGHRDNHNARLKRGKIAFDKKHKRRKPKSRCLICGKAGRSNPCFVCLSRDRKDDPR